MRGRVRNPLSCGPRVSTEMLASKWLSCTQSSQMQFAVRASSENRAWVGLDATLCDATGGVAQIVNSPSHNLTMHVGRPVTATCVCDGPVQRRLQSPGDIDFVPSGYRATWEDREPTTLLIINLMPSMMRTAAEGLGIDLDNVSVAPQLQLSDPRIRHIGWALQAELVGTEPSGKLYVESLGLALAAGLLARSNSVAPSPPGTLSKRRLSGVIDYIHDNLSRELSLSELASIAGLGPSHFSTLFKEATHRPVHQFIVHCRVEYALSLLADRKKSIAEVASMAGFYDQSHMSRCMRRVVGVTPSVVRRV
jgi:AraC family transcriptional regulator